MPIEIREIVIKGQIEEQGAELPKNLAEAPELQREIRRICSEQIQREETKRRRANRRRDLRR